MRQGPTDKFVASDFLHAKFWPTWIVIGFLRLISMLPYRVQLVVGKWLGKLIQVAPRSRQDVVDTNLGHCFPELSDDERREIRNQCYKNIGILVLELSMCWWWSETRLKQMVEIRGREHIDAVLASGRGVILLTGHFSTLEIGARLLALFMPVQVMYRTQKNLLFDRYLYSKRTSYFVQAVSRKNSRKLIKGIKNQILTWYAPDQDFRAERNVFASFMGIPAATITASSRLARSSNAAMLPFYPERKADGSGYILRVEPPLENFPSDDDQADAAKINTSIEKFIREHPDYYMWIHKRFRTRPPGEASFYL